jgi:hypothetical protein
VAQSASHKLLPNHCAGETVHLHNEFFFSYENRTSWRQVLQPAAKDGIVPHNCYAAGALIFVELPLGSA